MKISVFRNIRHNKPFDSWEVDEVLNYIKNTPDLYKNEISKARQSGKKNQQLTHKVWKRFSKTQKAATGLEGEYIPVNLYRFIKETKVPYFTFSAQIKEGQYRKINTIEAATGYIYLDIDKFEKLSFQDTWSILTDPALTYIKAVWKSFGNEGIGALVKIKGLTVENYKWNWKKLEKDLADDFNIVIDPATSDIVRPTILSSSPEIFIRQEEEVFPLIAVNSAPVETITVKASPMTNDETTYYLSKILKDMYSEPQYWVDNRLNYHFFVKLSSKCNHKGVAPDVLFNYLKTCGLKIFFPYRGEDEVESIINNIYANYESQFGQQQIIVKNKKEVNVETISVNNFYTGDVELKLQSLFSKFYKKQNWFAFTVQAKQNGIVANDVIKFLVGKNIDFDVQKVYDKDQYAFGLIVESNSKAIKDKLNDYKNHLLSKGNVLVASKTPKNVSSFLTKQFEMKKTMFGKITEDNIDEFISTFTKYCLQFSIDMQDILDFLLSKRLYVKNSERYIKFYVPETYSEFEWRKGYKVVKKDKETQFFNIKQSITLPNDKKISHLGVQFGDKTLIWGDTNQGKTTWVAKMNQKRVLLVPTVPSLESIKEEHNCSVLYESLKNAKEGDDFITCTYSSFKNFLLLASTWKEFPISDMELYIDEQHNFAASSPPSFRGKELNNILDSLSVFKKTIMMTGTPFPILHPELMKFTVSRINWESTPSKNLKVVKYTNLLKSLEQRLVKGSKNVIYLQNKRDDGKLGTLLDYLNQKGWTEIMLTNSDTKKSDGFQEIIKKGFIKDNTEILITTSVLVEASSIYNTDVTTAHILTTENPRKYEQFVNRFRKKLPEIVYLYEKLNDDEDETVVEDETFDPIAYQKHLIDETQTLLKYFVKPIKSNSYTMYMAEKNRRMQLFERNEYVRISEEGEYVVDYLSIANKAFEAESDFCRKNLKYMMDILAEYNWNFLGYEIDTDDLDANDKDTLKALHDERVEVNIQYANSVLDVMEVEGEELTIENVSDTKVGQYDNKDLYDKPNIELSLRYKAKYLTNFMDWLDICNYLRSWVNNGMVLSQWEKFLDCSSIQLASKMNIFNEKVKLGSSFSKSLVTYYMGRKTRDEKELKLFQKRDFVEIVEKRKHLHKHLENVEITPNFAFDILSRYFELEAVFDKKLGACYKFGGLRFENDLALLSTRIYEWFDEMNGKELLKTEIANKFIEIRKELPYFSLFPVSEEKAFEAMKNYIQIEKAGMKNIESGGKRAVYVMTSKIPEIVQNINFVPLRLKKLEDRDWNDLTEEQRTIAYFSNGYIL